MRVAIRRAAKVSTADYENTDVEISITSDEVLFEQLDATVAALRGKADAILREMIDDVEIGKRKTASRASRFGV